MTETVDVCIVGGGVLGMFTAMTVARSGKTVRLIDKAYAGSSRNNIGDVLLQGHHPETLAFMKFCSDEWQKAAKAFGEDLGYEQRGSILLAFNEVELEDLNQRAAKDEEKGLASEVVNGWDAVREKLGDELRLSESVVAGKFSELDGAVDTQEAMDGLRKLAIQAGVRIWGADKVSEFLIENNKFIGCKTDTGETCHAAVTILQAGVWATKMLKEVGIKMPMRPARCHLLKVRPNGRMPQQMLAHREATGGLVVKYMPKMGQAVVNYTGLMDQAQATWSTEVDSEAVEWMRERIGLFMEPLVNAALVEAKAVSLAVTPDLLPYIGPVEGVDGLLVALGMNGRSYAYAPGVAAVMAALVEGQEVPVGIEVFNPGRFMKA